MISSSIKRILQTGIALSTEKDKNRLFQLIINAAMDISKADAGTLYLYSKEEDCLHFKIMHNHTMKTYSGGDGQEVKLPPVPMTMENVCSFCALLRKSVNIPDVYDCHEFDFSGPKRYDQITNYRTKSMMVVPLANTKDETIGVLQLINARDKNDQVIPFSPELESIIDALASQAAMAITNSMYLLDIKDLFDSFVRVMITAIDQLSPYNVNHTRRVAELSDQFVSYLNSQYELGLYSERFSLERRQQLVMAAWMHDIGKVITPLEVMNKATRLGDSESEVLGRLDLAQATLRIGYLEGTFTAAEYEEKREVLSQCKEFVEMVNGLEFLSDENLAQLDRFQDLKYRTMEGDVRPLFTPKDYDNLSIRYGTLTAVEREKMKSHVLLTAKLLHNINFSSDLKDVPKFAAMHHEYLDGSGYPHGLTAKDLPLEARILAIIDIYEALTSQERPYKKAFESQRALDVLETMVKEGKLDSSLVRLLGEFIGAQA